MQPRTFARPVHPIDLSFASLTCRSPIGWTASQAFHMETRTRMQPQTATSVTKLPVNPCTMDNLRRSIVLDLEPCAYRRVPDVCWWASPVDSLYEGQSRRVHESKKRSLRKWNSWQDRDTSSSVSSLAWEHSPQLNMSPIQVHFLPPNTLQSQNSTSELRSVKALVRSNAACFSHGQRLRRRQLEQEPKKSQEDVLADAITQCAPPRAHFHKGNSDPFSSLAIDLTPELYDAVQFRATEWFPAIFSPWGSPWAAMSSRIMEDEVVAALQEDASAAASSLHCLTLYPGSSRDQSKAVKYQRMRLKVKAASLLRKRLQTKPLDPQVCMIVQLLFHAAVAAGDLQEALFHGTAIRHVLMKQQDWPGDLINSGTTWHDAHLSITFMQPTIFNIQASPNAMKDVFELVTQVQPSITRVDAACYEPLHKGAIQGRVLA